MVEINDDPNGGYRRVEILTGPGRRRRWPADEKAQIVAETLMPGARVSDVARRRQLCTQQVFTWRRQARHAQAMISTDPVAPSLPTFVPIVAESPAPAVTPAANSAPPTIEVKRAGAVVRVASGMDATTLTTVLRAVRVSASRQ
jgi:transposase